MPYKSAINLLFGKLQRMSSASVKHFFLKAIFGEFATLFLNPSNTILNQNSKALIPTPIQPNSEEFLMHIFLPDNKLLQLFPGESLPLYYLHM